MASPPSSSANVRDTWLRGLAGVAIGGVFFWLALRQATWAEVAAILGNLQLTWVGVAIAAYVVSLLVRVIRWHKLLEDIKSLSYRSVGLALVVGYAMNNLLPARLGELFRADFAGRRYAISRSSVIGSIAIERTLDGLIVVLSLVLGRFFIQSHTLLNSLTIGGFVLFAGIFLMLLGISRHSQLSQFVWLPEPILRRIQSFQHGLAGLRLLVLAPAVLTSLVVWLFEGIAHWSILQAVGVSLTGLQMLSVVGVVNLSTLIPSAPGFAGTYQYAYAFVLGLFGYVPAQGVAAATAAQLFLLGTTTLFGIGMFMLLNMRHMAIATRQPPNSETNAASKNPSRTR